MARKSAVYIGNESARMAELEGVPLASFKARAALIYFVLFIAASNYIGNGATIGKKIMKIRAVSLVHHRLSLWHSVERALGYGASALEGFFGFFQYFIHPTRRTVHDRIAETIVVSERGQRPAPQKRNEAEHLIPLP